MKKNLLTMEHCSIVGCNAKTTIGNLGNVSHFAVEKIEGYSDEKIPEIRI
ncbi:MAG: hypothetical protein GY786_16485 [Proteobacteria bacterium]|nr:hypothetical protein [Pseudomonadota bacterium]